MTLKRQTQVQSALITNSIATTTAIIEIHDNADVGLLLGSGWTACDVTVFAWSHTADAWLPVKNSSGVSAMIATTASHAYQLPSSVFPFERIALVSNNALNNAVTVEIHSKG